MEEKRQEVMANLVNDRLSILRIQQRNLEEQITKDTANEVELQEAYLAQRREKLADIIKEIKILEDEKQETDSLDQRGEHG